MENFTPLYITPKSNVFEISCDGGPKECYDLKDVYSGADLQRLLESYIERNLKGVDINDVYAPGVDWIIKVHQRILQNQ